MDSSMKTTALIALTVGFALLQGCSFSLPNYSSDQTAVIDDATYDDYDSSPDIRRNRQGHNEDEMPVQMTKHDSDMQAVAPEPKTSNAPAANNNNNVLLPISSGDLE